MAAAMACRILHILWLLFVALWFSVIAPGHTRGTIQLCGSLADGEGSSHCCAMPGMGGDAGRDGEPDAPPTDPAARCAICYLNSILNPPAPPMSVTVQVFELGELAPLEPVALVSAHRPQSLHIRGPPLAV